MDASHDTLVQGFRNGDSAALEDLIERDGRWVRGAVYAVLGDRASVDDVVQDVWITAWRRAGDLEDPRKWRSWLFRLARNQAIDYVRRRKNRNKLLGRFADLLSRRPHASAPADASVVQDEEHQRILACIESLPEIYREAFVLRHLEDWSYRKIAETLELPEDTVETRLVRARRLLRDKLAKSHAATR